MEIDSGRRNAIVSNRFLPHRYVGAAAFRADEGSGSCSPPRQSHSSSPPPGTSSIEHRVSRFDTLAGIAIKYGVEVADIKRMNGLVTDLHMFAHNKIYIPLPGRHPPSPDMSNASPTNNRDRNPPTRPQTQLLESFHSLNLTSLHNTVSPAMTLLQGYYGLTSPNSPPNCAAKMTTVSGNAKTDGPMRTPSPNSNLPPTARRKSTSYANGSLLHTHDAAETDGGGYSDKSIRRRLKTEVDSPSTPQLFINQENGGVFCGKGFVPRPKTTIRTDAHSPCLIPLSPATSLMSNGSLSFRKSSSTSNLPESETSFWPATNWVLKADSITRPIFDGFPTPVTSRWNKAALD